MIAERAATHSRHKSCIISPMNCAHRIPGRVVRGHRVASGQGRDPRFPDGTLRLQWPLFQAGGLRLDGLYPGTVNLAIAPWRYRVVAPRLTLRKVRWHPAVEPEDFSFFDVSVWFGPQSAVAGLVYRPHPETKPGHHQPADVLELLLPHLEGLAYGSQVEIAVPPEQMRFEQLPDAAK